MVSLLLIKAFLNRIRVCGSTQKKNPKNSKIILKNAENSLDSSVESVNEDYGWTKVKVKVCSAPPHLI